MRDTALPRRERVSELTPVQDGCRDSGLVHAGQFPPAETQVIVVLALQINVSFTSMGKLLPSKLPV